ncbi:MAG: MlaC/ttg2D family ABC transporter substrate-binding protein [Hyphomicrobiales bacterium]
MATGAEAASAGEKYVISAGNDLIAAAKRGTTSAFRSVLKKYVNVSSMALFALGKHRRKLPAGMKSEYVALVEEFVVQTLTQYGKKFKGNNFQVTNARATSRGMSVESKLKFLGGRQPQKVSWKLIGSGGKYRVSDINFQGVWLASLLRSTFTGHMKKNGNDINALIAYLRKAAGPGGAKIASDFQD